MNFDWLFLVVNFLAFFLALTVHEFSHALVAYYQGDRTAAYAGRLSLNPLAHIDLFGTILLPLLLIISNAGIVFGWAKPVPVNYYNLKNAKWGPAMVSLAGPAANFVFAVFSLILLKIVIAYTALSSGNLLVTFLVLLIIVNVVLMVFNLIPIPPLDGSKILFAIIPDKYDGFKQSLEQYGLILLLALLFFGSSFLDTIFNVMIRFIFSFL